MRDLQRVANRLLLLLIAQGPYQRRRRPRRKSDDEVALEALASFLPGHHHHHPNGTPNGTPNGLPNGAQRTHAGAPHVRKQSLLDPFARPPQPELLFNQTPNERT